jgi:menaquinone-dependent protoporphyrinogen oxidase
MPDVLVAYASKRGSTAEIAAAIAQALRESGLSVVCTPAGQVHDLAEVGAVVLGSAVYTRRWRGEARRFLRRYATELARRPLWVFSSGPVGEPKGEANTSWLEPPGVVHQVEELGARQHVVFGGSMPAEPHGFLERVAARNTPPEYRDLRDWDEIRAWAAGIASELRA